MLDTDIASYLIKGKAPSIDGRLSLMAPEQVCISVITRAELLYGIRLKPGAQRLAMLVDQFLTRIHSFPWDDGAADHFATIAATLTRAGTPVGRLDAMIAGHAMAVGAILVTNNARHFSRVTDLVVEDWMRPI